MMKANGFKINDSNRGCLFVILVCLITWAVAAIILI